MKIQVVIPKEILIDVPEYVYKAYNEQQFEASLVEYIYLYLFNRELYKINPYHIEEAILDYKRRRKGKDRLPNVMEAEEAIGDWSTVT